MYPMLFYHKFALFPSLLFFHYPQILYNYNFHHISHNSHVFLRNTPSLYPLYLLCNQSWGRKDIPKLLFYVSLKDT